MSGLIRLRRAWLNAAAVAAGAPGHRYWRLYITAWANGTYHIISEAEFRVAGVDQVPTLTSDTGGTVKATANQEYTGSRDAYRAFNGIFGDDGWWCYPATGTNDWLMVDFGASGPWPMLDAVGIAPREDAGAYICTAFSVQWSDDNTNWTTVNTFSPGTSGWTANTLRTFTL